MLDDLFQHIRPGASLVIIGERELAGEPVASRGFDDILSAVTQILQEEPCSRVLPPS